MKLLNGCKFVTATTGTADFDDGVAVTGWRNLSDAGAVNGVVYPYRAQAAGNTEWEHGLGTYNSGSGLIERTTIYESSNSDAKVDFSEAPTVLITPFAATFDDIEGLAVAMSVVFG